MENIVNDVVVGNSGYLFLYQGGQRQFDFLLKKSFVKKENVYNFVGNIESRIKYFDKNEIKYRHLVFPSKALVKTKFLPEELNNVHSLYKEYYEEMLIDHNENILYLLNMLKENENNYSTFYKFDTHITVRALLDITKELFTQLDVDFDDTIYDHLVVKDKGGDLTNMLNIKQSQKEEFLILNNIYKVGNREFLPGNTNEVLIMHNSKKKKRVLVFGDSFLKDMTEIFAYFFKDVVYVRSSHVHYDIVNMFDPDIVISGNAERYMCIIQSDLQAHNFIREQYRNKEYSPSEEFEDALFAQLSYRHNRYLYDIWKEKQEEAS